MKHIFSSLPVQLALTILFAVTVGTVLPLSAITTTFTVSALLKELLEFFLPFIVFFFVSSGVMAFRKNSVVMIALLLAVVFVSNGLTNLYTYFVGGAIVHGLDPQAMVCSTASGVVIVPHFSLGIINPIRSEQALLVALMIGVLLTFFPVAALQNGIERGKRAIEWGMTRLFIPVLPLYVLGFFLKMVNELPVAQLCSLYGTIFIIAVIMQLVYLAGAYLVAAGFSLSRGLSTLTTAVPSYLTALGTMSSVASLPVSVVCAQKNTGNRSLSQFAMPILANIHLMGDSVSVPLFCIVTMKAFLGTTPDLGTYLIFIGYFCLTMLAVSGIPGGGIIVMLPLLKSLFGFTPEMLSVMTALYLLQDGFGTAANVMGDGALVMILHRLSRALRITGSQKTEESNG